MSEGTRNEWVGWAIDQLEIEAARCGETSMLRLTTPAGFPTIYMKDESTQPTGSLKHRLARSLFTYALYNGWIGPKTRVIECSSGSTAVSEAYFARMLGLQFTAVVPRSTSPEKLAQIESHGGRCLLVDSEQEAKATCQLQASNPDTHFMDQFTYAERAVDWRSPNSLTRSAFQQLSRERHAAPTWIVCGAGTGGTATAFGRYLRVEGLATKLCLADPQGSIYHRAIHGTTVPGAAVPGSLVEGIGRRQCEPSFLPTLIDRAVAVCDADSIGAAHALSRYLGKAVGGSSGTNLWVSMALAEEMHRAGIDGSILTLICDTGERYRSTVFNDAWLNKVGIDQSLALERTEAFLGMAPRQSQALKMAVGA